LQIFELLINQPIGLHILEGILESDKTFFIKYFTQYFQVQNKNALLVVITVIVVL
jgi:hypothetical protein